MQLRSRPGIGKGHHRPGASWNFAGAWRVRTVGAGLGHALCSVSLAARRPGLGLFSSSRLSLPPAGGGLGRDGRNVGLCAYGRGRRARPAADVGCLRMFFPAPDGWWPVAEHLAPVLSSHRHCANAPVAQVHANASRRSQWVSCKRENGDPFWRPTRPRHVVFSTAAVTGYNRF